MIVAQGWVEAVRLHIGFICNGGEELSACRLNAGKHMGDGCTGWGWRSASMLAHLRV